MTKYWRKMLTDARLTRMEVITRFVHADFETEPADFNGEAVRIPREKIPNW